MTDHQFECLHILLTGIANDLSVIRELLEKQQPPDQELCHPNPELTANQLMDLSRDTKSFGNLSK